MAGRATVDGVVVAEAEVMCKLADKDEKQPAPSRCRSIRPPSSIRRRASRRSADIGPYCIIGPEVEIGAAHAPDGATSTWKAPPGSGRTTSSSRTARVGVASQDLKYKGERAETRIGHRNRIREFVTIHRGTAGRRPGHPHRGRQPADGLHARGARCARSAATASWATPSRFAGHVTVGDWAIIERVQRRAPVLPHRAALLHRRLQRDHAGRAAVLPDRDARARSKVYGANKVGLERRGFDTDAIEKLQTAMRLLTRAGLNTSQAIERIRAEVPPSPEVDELLEFIRTSERGVIK